MYRADRTGESAERNAARNDEHSENVRAEPRAHEVDKGSSSSVASAAWGSIASTRHLIQSLHGRMSQDARAEVRIDLGDGALGGLSTGPHGRLAGQSGSDPPPQMGVAMPATEQWDEEVKVRKKRPSP